MTLINGKLITGVLIFTVVSIVIGGVVGGIEGIFASLGAMVLVGITGTGVYALARILRGSHTSVKGGCPEYGSTSTISSNAVDLKEAELITEKDKMIIMEHVDELFAIAQQQSQEKPVEAESISKEDRRIIIEHVDELFAIAREQSPEMPVEAEPISKKDKRLIMEHINEFLEIHREESEEKAA